MFILEVQQLVPELPDFGTYRKVKLSQQYFTESEKDKALELYREVAVHLPSEYRVDLLHIVEGHKVPITEVSHNG